MRFSDTGIEGVKIVEPTAFGDHRGFFMETWREEVFREAGIADRFVQENHSKSLQGTLRGLHYQLVVPQGKLVRVVAGEVFDVAVDLRIDGLISAVDKNREIREMAMSYEGNWRDIVVFISPFNDEIDNESFIESVVRHVLEAVGQHFLQDAWSMGHMWERWGGPEFGQNVFMMNPASGDTLIVRDYTENLDEVARILQDLDHRPEQVLKATDGKGVNLIVDMLSGSVANGNMQACALLARIVNVGRPLSIGETPDCVPYADSYRILLSLTRLQARQYGRYGINANSLLPGDVSTEAHRRGKSHEEFRRYIEAECPLGRMADSRDLGAMVAFLASPLSSYINGQVIVVDGGLPVWDDLFP